MAQKKGGGGGILLFLFAIGGLYGLSEWTGLPVSTILIILAVLIIGIAILVVVRKKQKGRSFIVETETSGDEDDYTASVYDEMPSDAVAHIQRARDAEDAGDYLATRIHYLSAVEWLKTRGGKEFIPVAQQEYDEFVLRDPVYEYLMSKLLDIISNEKGILQSNITKDFEAMEWGQLAQSNRRVAKDDITYGLYFAAKFGHIVRIKQGRSYRLYLPGTEPQEESTV